MVEWLERFRKVFQQRAFDLSDAPVGAALHEDIDDDGAEGPELA